MNLNAAAGLSGMLKEGQKHFEGDSRCSKHILSRPPHALFDLMGVEYRRLMWICRIGGRCSAQY